ATGILPSWSEARLRSIHWHEKATNATRARLLLLKLIQRVPLCFFIDLDRIFFTQLPDPPLFEFVLVVGNYICPCLIQRLFTRGQYFVNPRKVIHSLVLSGMGAWGPGNGTKRLPVAGIKKSLLRPDSLLLGVFPHSHRIAFSGDLPEALYHHRVRGRINSCLSPLLSPVPGAICLEKSRLPGRVLCGAVPNFLFHDLKQQDALVILVVEHTEFRLFGSHRPAYGIHQVFEIGRAHV